MAQLRLIAVENLREIQPREIAAIFCEMDDIEQASFFQNVGIIAGEQWHNPQMQYLGIATGLRKQLSPEGIDVINSIHGFLALQD